MKFFSLVFVCTGIFFLFGFTYPFQKATIHNQSLSIREYQNLFEREALFRAQGDLFLEKKEYKKAIESYNNALTLIPYKFETLYNKACAFALIGNTEKALETLFLAGLIHHYAIDLAEDDPDFDTIRDQSEFQTFLKSQSS